MKKTWYTIKNGNIDRVQTTRDGEKPLPENLDWQLSPNNSVLHPETPIERYDENMRYLNDEEWLAKQGKKDLRGDWYDKETGEKKQIRDINETIDEAKNTREPPIENEPYQLFDAQKNKWVVDEAKKEAAEKENAIAQKQSAIEDAERRIQRSTRAKLDGTATEEDNRYFTEINSEIIRLREEKRQLLSA